MSKWPAERKAELRRRWAEDPSRTRIARAMGVTPSTIAGAARRFNLHYPARNAGLTLKEHHPAVRDARTLFQAQVREPSAEETLLKCGANQRKLGHRVTKGRWSGMPIFSLTLEERATCPRSCAVFNSCYGNGMNLSVRYQHGPELEARLWVELGKLQSDHPSGFVVRLHILWDFPSVSYVEFWARMGKTFPALHVFGYTAWHADTPIGAAIVGLRDRKWSRFAVRTSGAAAGPRTMVIPPGKRAPAGVVLCPAQSEKLAQRGKQISCGSCALCWNSKRPIGFLQH